MSKKLLKNIDWIISVPVPNGNGLEDKCIDSSKFSIENNGLITKWEITCNFNDRQSGHFSAYLVSKSDKVNFDLECTFIVLDRVNGTSNKIGTIEKSASYWKKNEGFGISKLLANQKLFRTRNCYVKDGKFHLIVIIKQVIRNLQNSETYYYEKYLLESLKNRLDQSEIIELFDTMTSENFRDDTIILETADGVKMSASKEIISKKSPVFAAMFTTNMVERSRGVVKVIDFSGKALRESLRFMYFGRVQSIEEIVTELYEVAKVYLIEGLGDLCLSSIKSRTNFSNVFEVLEFAHVHDETGIFDDCCEIIWRYLDVNRIQQQMKDLSIDLQNHLLTNMIKFRYGVIFCEVEVNSTD